MALQFPNLVPSSRVFTPGDYNHTSRASMGGIIVTSSHSDAITGQSLHLSFLALKVDDATTLALHWSSVQGQFGLFALPAEIWNGTTNPSVFTPAGYLWKYADVPKIDEIPCGLNDVSVNLELVPINAFGAIVIAPAARVITRAPKPTATNDGAVVPAPAAMVITRAPKPIVTGV